MFTTNEFMIVLTIQNNNINDVNNNNNSSNSSSNDDNVDDKYDVNNNDKDGFCLRLDDKIYAWEQYEYDA